MVTNDAYGKPFQLKFVRAAQMELFANIICDPPLGQSTVIPHNREAVNFTVLIESSISFPEQSWEAVLWHNCHEDGEWHELHLEEAHTAASPLSISSVGRPKTYRRYFNGVIARPGKKQGASKFTLKYRLSTSESWRWVNEQAVSTDGELLFQSQLLNEDLSSYFEKLSPDFTVTPIPSEAPETFLWSITKPVKGVHGKSTSAISNDILGLPRDFTRWLALVRIWTPWLAPRHGRSHFFLTEDAVMCSFLRNDGLHLVLLAISGIEDILTVIKHDDNGNVVVSSRNDSLGESQATVIAAVGTTFESANAACMYYARKLAAATESAEVEAEEAALPSDTEAALWQENWYDGLTYCTWNGLGQDLTQDKIFKALETLQENNIKITNLIIDDNWQSLDNHGESQFRRGWTDFDANKEGFPKGLKHTISEIRDRHTNIQHVAVWHALFGYWGGISPDGNIAKKYKTKQVRKKEGLMGGTITVVDPDDVQRMYNDFYQFLQQCRVDSVKTDAQFFVDLLDDAEDRRRFIKAYQDAWTVSSLRYFSIKAISCMSQAPQILFHSQLPRNKPRVMVRNSDDFFPEIPASHPWHIFTNAHNALFTSHLNVLPDWDMFQTSHPYSSFHAAGRCVSGGPIYFTDEPGKHDVNLIKEMTAQSPKDKTIILRPDCIGKSRGVYTAYEEEKLLRVGTYHGSKGQGTGILGIFNVSEKQLSGFVGLHEFPGVELQTEYVVRAHTTGEISGSMKVDDKLALVSLMVDTKGWEILSAYPLQSFKLPDGGKSKIKVVKTACVGLLGKMTGAAAIASSGVLYTTEEHGKLHVAIALKALGLLGVYISDLPRRSLDDEFLILCQGKVIPPHTVKKSSTVDNLLEIDIERAWKEMKLVSGWSNEARVDLYLN
ncbi:MAG: hypothetical protein MMC33_003384 [Icmadophila ericetorum]|nr:hypothetical protein [Icmadophila ericetorum]